MKIMALSDTHGDITRVEKIATEARAHNVDLVMICGDFVGHNEHVPPRLIGTFLEKGLKVGIISGNHESEATTNFVAESYGIKNFHGHGVVYGDVGVFACGGANIGVDRLTDDEIFESLKQGFEKVKHAKKKVMVTHVHPSGSTIEKMTDIFPGSSGVARALKEFKPDIMICGHVHEASGLEEQMYDTKIVNVAKIGKMIDVSKI